MMVTFIAISDGEEVYIVGVAIEKQQRDPTVTAVYWNDEQYTHYPTLL